MNASAEHAAKMPPPPLPPNQFKWFMLFWHAFLLGGLFFTLLWAIQRQPEEPLWHWASLGALIVVQAGVYLKMFPTRVPKEHSLGGWAAYFSFSLTIWLVECRLDGHFEWLIGPYLGQMLGALPPKRSLPAVGVILALYLGWHFGAGGWPHLSLWLWAGVGAAVLSWVGLGLFLHRLVSTSQDRARLIEELQAAKRALELARARDEELAVLRERERLARDLHDGLGHALVTLSVQLEAIQKLRQVDPVRTGAMIEEMQRLTRSSTEALRRSLANLRAPGLGERQLTEALRACAEEAARRADWQLACALDERANALPPRVAEALWHAGQEGLANVEQHARARRVSLALSLDPTQARLRLEDDGVGLPDQPEAKPGHFGLRGLRERIEGLGGGFSLSSAGPRGTLLQAHLPVLGLDETHSHTAG